MSLAFGSSSDASIWVAKKCGYQEFLRATYKDHPTMLYRRQT